MRHYECTQKDKEGRVRGVSFITFRYDNPLRSAQPFFVHKIYQLDYSRKTDELRMLEMFLPQVSRTSQMRRLLVVDVTDCALGNAG